MKSELHHFAHTDATCRAVSAGRDVELPLFDRFNLHLTPKEYTALLQFEKKGVDSKYRSLLEAKDTIVYNPHKGSYGGWELTKLGSQVALEPKTGLRNKDMRADFARSIVIKFFEDK